MQVYIKTYGCSLNHADSSIIDTILKEDGIRVCNSESEADVVLVNTCVVKSSAERRIIDYISKRASEGKRIVATGCMAGSYPERISKYAPEASVITTPNIMRISDAVRESASGNTIMLSEYRKIDRVSYFNKDSFGRVVEQIPISDGCMSSCGFCATKLSRGTLNSFAESSILNAVRFAVKRGAKEIQITSQDVGAYGLDRGTNISELMWSISEIEGDFKVRIGMLNPEHLWRYIENFAAALSSDRFYKFVHLPIQSGSEKVLRAMGRGYTPEQVTDHIAYLRKKATGVSFMTDLIVGYPTETDKDFADTLDFVRATEPDTVNLSKFTARPGTRASRMTQIPDKEIKRRSTIATKEVHDAQRLVNQRHIGKRYKCLITEQNDRSSNGRTDSYKQVVLADSSIIPGERRDVEITAVTSNVLYGKVL